jgi:hypothetical protein
MAYVTKDLEQEYLKTFGRGGYPRPASTLVDWFFSREDEFEESAQMQTSSDQNTSSRESLEGQFGTEVYEAMLREHIEAEKQLEKRTSPIVVVLDTEHLEWDCHENDILDDMWDVVSFGSIELDDWEKVVLE